MPKFHYVRTLRTYETTLFTGERTGNYSDYQGEGNVTARNEREAEAKVRAEGGNFRIDEVLDVKLYPFEEWRREAVKRRWARHDAELALLSDAIK